MADARIGTAGWTIPRAMADGFPGDGSHLARYARVLTCAEINSSFHRSHRPEVYARWAAQTPTGFRFSVKLPRAITHDQRLRASRAPLTRFMEEVSGLGDRLGVLLVQLPPSLGFETRPVRTFFDLLAGMHGGPVVCEPRHATWFEPSADAVLVKLRVGRVAADPARCPAAAVPGGWLGPAGDGAGAVVYHTLARIAPHLLLVLQRRLAACPRWRSEPLAARSAMLVHLRQHGVRRRGV